jgi:hypothetical protein
VFTPSGLRSRDIKSTSSIPWNFIWSQHDPTRAASAVTLPSISRGDARNLGIASGIADAVLLLGPLYHLKERLDRMQAFAKRVAYSNHGVSFSLPGFPALPHLLMDCPDSFDILHFVKLLRLIWRRDSIITPPTILCISQKRTFIVMRNWPQKFERPDLGRCAFSPSKDLCGVRRSSGRLGAIRHSEED